MTMKMEKATKMSGAVETRTTAVKMIRKIQGAQAKSRSTVGAPQQVQGLQAHKQGSLLRDLQTHFLSKQSFK